MLAGNLCDLAHEHRRRRNKEEEGTPNSLQQSWVSPLTQLATICGLSLQLCLGSRRTVNGGSYLDLTMEADGALP